MTQEVPSNFNAPEILAKIAIVRCADPVHGLGMRRRLQHGQARVVSTKGGQRRQDEEPQINVTFAGVLIPFPGASATEIENLVAGPDEQVLSEIKGIEHVFSVSRPGMAVITVQYEVGEDRTDAVVHLLSNQDWLPRNLGVGSPVVKLKGIDDVPIIIATLHARQAP
jgi:multidrug efflux pump subunit AcrB